jgi:hypothetical protein
MIASQRAVCGDLQIMAIRTQVMISPSPLPNVANPRIQSAWRSTKALQEFASFLATFSRLEPEAVTAIELPTRGLDQIHLEES